MRLLKDTKVVAVILVAAAFVLVVFLTSRDTGPSAKIDQEANQQAVQEAAERAAADPKVPPPFYPPDDWKDPGSKPTVAEFAEVINRFCVESTEIALEEEARIAGTADKRGWPEPKFESAMFKVRADEGDRVKKGVDRLGLPDKKVDVYRAWRSSLEQRIEVLYDISSALRREDVRDATKLQSQLRVLDLDSDGTSRQLGVTECETRPIAVS